MFLNYFIVVMLAIGNIILIATLMIYRYIHDLLDYIFAFYDFHQSSTTYTGPIVVLYQP